MATPFKTLAAALVAIVPGAVANAQSAPDACLPLQDALRLSVLNSPSVGAAEAARDRALADLVDAEAIRRPQLSAFARTQAGDEGLTGAGIENTLGLRASQRIYDFGVSRLDRQAAQSRVDARRFSIDSAETNAALDTADAYIGLVEIEARLSITADREAFFRRQLAATEAALDLGAATRADLAEVAARLAEASADRLELTFERDRLSTALSSDLGEVVRPCTVTSVRPHADGTSSIIDRVDAALENNSELRVLSAEINAQDASVERAARNRLPAIDLVGVASYAYDDRVGQWEYRDRIGVDVSVPLLSGNALNAERRRAGADLATRRSEREAFRRDLIEAVEVSSRRLLSLEAQLARRQDVVDRQADQFSAAESEFDAGVRTLPELVEDRLELEAARLQAVTIEFSLARERINLSALTGDLVDRS
ncbi:MAG: TolC family protein [Pseudomonadota bacterium]